MRNKVIFLINTEFVFLISLLYLNKYFPKDGNYHFVFWKRNENRFREINFDKFRYSYEFFYNNFMSSTLFPNRQISKFLNQEIPNEIVFQNSHDFSNNIIINHYKKLNPSLKLTYIADSIAIDRVFSKKLLLVFTLKLYFRKFINGYYSLPWTVCSSEKMLRKTDILIANNNKGGKRYINSNELLKEINTIEGDLTNLFGNDLSKFEDCDIIFFTQPILSHTTIEIKYRKAYINTLEELFKTVNSSGKRLVIKVHPGESYKDYIKYQSENIYVDRNANLPAEIILNLVNSPKIVLSFWSSISVFDVYNRNRHFWLNEIIGFKIRGKQQYDTIKNIKNIEELSNIINY